MKIHPVADLFPMMSDDELTELATDIKANGQIHPIIIDNDIIIDGRNRLEACNRAGIQPTFAELNGQDPVAFILSANIARRHLSKGQQAMAVAKALLLSNKTQTQAAKQTQVSQTRIAQASIVLQYAPDLADGVLSGALALNVAYEQAQKRKDQSSSTDEALKRLHKESPELADLVVEERMSLGEAEAGCPPRRVLFRSALNADRERVLAVPYGRMRN
jgi:ParB/RepB/Spo0J family partition protein